MGLPMSSSRRKPGLGVASRRKNRRIWVPCEQKARKRSTMGMLGPP